MSLRLQSPFLGTCLNGRNSVLEDPRRRVRRGFRRRICVSSDKQNDWLAQVAKFSRFCGKNVQLLRNSLASRSRVEVKCLREPFARSKSLVRSLAPVWEEGLFFLRCSVFFAVISGVCLLVWYGQNKARAFVDTKLLPSVCSMLSETIQREVDFGRVKRVSPLSFTLEACSTGPHGEEFSCAEVPTMKLCLRPFASLRRGKVVVDAILINPTVLVAQKKDFTWLGIPLSEATLQTRLSSEEGIDFRTKTRRISREEAGIRWANERDNDARIAAEMGYTVPCKVSSQAKDDSQKHDTDVTNSNSFICMDEKMHSADQHCMDTGVNYDVKHAELEKSFGIKIPGSGLKFLSKVLNVPRKYKFKWNSKSHNNSVSDASAKRRVLERSASAAVSYFHSLSQQDPDEPSLSSGVYDELSLDMLLVKGERESSDSHVLNGANDLDGEDRRGRENGLLVLKKATTLDKFTVARDPFLVTLVRLCALLQTKGSSCLEDNGNATESETLSSQGEDTSMNAVNQSADFVPRGNQIANQPHDFTFRKHKNHPSSNHSVPSWPWNIKLKEGVFDILTGSSKKSTGGTDPNAVDSTPSSGERLEKLHAVHVEKTLPIMLDSVQFKGGTLILLAYGDTEPREMRNVHGHVKFQNHYGRIYVQLGGNCNMWRSDVTSEDGGLLSVHVFVDTVEQNWHANLKVANFFVPIFERILEIPIEWSKGRATGEVLF